MSDWDADSDQLRANLQRVVTRVREDARRRLAPAVEQVRGWHSEIMHGLDSPGPERSGRYRGEPGLEDCEVAVGGYSGVAAHDVGRALQRFEARLRRTVEALDGLIPLGKELSDDELAAILDLCAWVHSEWVRIHPFANGNGRTARLLANSIAMRYGLPPFVRLRPRPGEGYGIVAALAMRGQWQPTVPVFRQMLREAIRA